MGCDIHMAIEVFGNLDHIKQWEVFALDIPTARDYTMFGAMAGVRDHTVTPVVSPRGMPTDSARATKYWVERGAGHTQSWFYHDEFAEAMRLVREADNISVCKVFLAVNSTLKALAKVYGETNVRLVFFFDS